MMKLIGDVFKDNADNEANADDYDDGGPKGDAVWIMAPPIITWA